MEAIRWKGRTGPLSKTLILEGQAGIYNGTLEEHSKTLTLRFLTQEDNLMEEISLYNLLGKEETKILLLLKISLLEEQIINQKL